MIKIILLILTVFIVLIGGVTYSVVRVLDLPIPIIGSKALALDLSRTNNIINAWENVRIYKPVPKLIEETIPVVVVEEPVQDEEKIAFLEKFSDINKESFTNYLYNNQEELSAGFNNFFLDKADTTNSFKEIKSTNGDYIQVIDNINDVLIIGLTINNRNAKLAIIKNQNQLGFSVVENLRYWDELSVHAVRERAILAINANDYIWRDGIGIMTGLAKRHGELVRRANNQANVIGVNESGELIVGGRLTDYYSASESLGILINQDIITAGLETDTVLSARTAIGKRANGDVLFLVVDGSTDGSGATRLDIANIMQKYGASIAVEKGSGVGSIMWWNGRVITEPYLDILQGVRLPTAWLVRPLER